MLSLQGARHAISAENYPPHAIPAAVSAENVEGSPHAMSAAIPAEKVGDWVRRPAEFTGTTHASRMPYRLEIVEN